MTTAHHEIPSQGNLAQRYYSSGAIRRVPAPQIHESSMLGAFHVVAAKQVRSGGNGTTEAMELTLKIDDARKDMVASQIQSGLVFALEPKNHQETVDAILAALKPSPQEQADGRVTVPVNSAFMMTNDEQTLPKRDILAGLVDVSRPTEQLVNLLAVRAKEGGKPLPEPFDAAELAQCYSVAELLHYRPGVLTLEDVYANQPPMKPRPYTISDFNREEGTFNILISGVSARLPEGDPLGIKGHDAGRVKDGGTASGMLLDIATARDGQPDALFPVNGYLLTNMPRLLFPGLLERTDAVEKLATANPRVDAHLKQFEQATADTTLYFLATGSGMAPYMSLLRELSRRQQADPGHKSPFPGRIVLINGGRHEQDELYAEECRQFVKDGLIDAYHAASSSTGKEKQVTLKDGQLHEQEIQANTEGGKYYIQDVLQANYGHKMDADLRAGKAKVYVCGTQGALRGVFSKWPEAFRENRAALQHTASIPGRYFENFWKRMNEVTSHREPQPVESRGENPGAWTRRHLKIAEIREGSAALGFAR